MSSVEMRKFERVADVHEGHRDVVGPGVRPKRSDDPERDADYEGPEHREHTEMERDREALLDDVVHGLVSQRERRAEVQREDARV